MDKQWYSGRYDRAFKEVMLKEENRDLLIMLIEHILNIKIEHLEVLNVEKYLGNTHIKGQRLDLNLKTNKGRINVEVNSNDNTYTHKKNFSYLADTYSHSVLVGKEYDNTLYIQINLSYGLNSNIKPINIYKVMNENQECYVDNFLIYNLNMEYYMKLWYNKNIKQVKKDFILVMLGLERNYLKELAKDYKVVSRYMNELDKVNEEPEFREYMSREKEEQLLRNSLIRDARLEGIEEERNIIVEKLLSKGMTQEEVSELLDIEIIGETEYQRIMTPEREERLLRNSLIRDARLEGVEEGRKLGIEEGRKQANELIANMLLENGMTQEEISELLDIN